MTNSAIVVRAGKKIAIRRVDVTACRSACIFTERGSRDVAIEGNGVSGSAWDGNSLNRTSNARLVGNTIRSNTAAGITGRVGYMVGADAAANCSDPSFTANLSRGDLFLQNPNEAPDAMAYGPCVQNSSRLSH